MAYLAVNKDGTEVISDYDLYRNGYYKVKMTCDKSKCNYCLRRVTECKKDEDGEMYRERTYSAPPKMKKEQAIKELSFWDNYQFDENCYQLDYIVVLPKGSIKKLIGRDMTWEEDPIEL